MQDISPQDGMFNVNDNEQVEFVLSGLLPNKQYFLKSAINVRDDSVDSGYQVGHGIVVIVQPSLVNNNHF